MKNFALRGKLSQKSVCSEWGSESKSMRTGYTTQGKRLDMKVRSTTFYPELAGVDPSNSGTPAQGRLIIPKMAPALGK